MKQTILKNNKKIQNKLNYKQGTNKRKQIPKQNRNKLVPKFFLQEYSEFLLFIGWIAWE